MSFLSSLMSVAHAAIQTLPKPLLTKIATAMPYSPDKFAAGGFFAPNPTLPPLLPNAPHMDAPDASHLVLVPYCCLTGAVTLVEKRRPNADWNHETFRLLPDDSRVLNMFAPKLPGAHDPDAVAGSASIPNVLECEPPVGAPLPAVGDRVRVWGRFIVDLANGWTEMHPVTSWTKI